VIIKKLRFNDLDEDSKNELIHGIRVLLLLPCPVVPEFFGLWKGIKGKYYNLIFEYIEGATLRVKLNQEIQMEFKEKVTISYQISEVLCFLHNMKLIHRDIKPENIMITTNDKVKLIDFGTAKLASKTITFTSKAVGTTFYMSPDNFDFNSNDEDGDGVDNPKPIAIGTAADVWSFGVMLTEILSGVFPYSHVTKNENYIESWLIQKKAFPIPQMIHIHKEYREFLPIIGKCLEIDKFNRCKSSEVLDFIRPFLNQNHVDVNVNIN